MSETVMAAKNDKLIVSASPHITRNRTTRGIMLDVCIALVPAIAAAVVFFGITALTMVGICIAACVSSEFLFTIIRKGGVPFKKGWLEKAKKNAADSSIKDCSAVVTGILLALNLPVILKEGGKLSGIFDLSGVDLGMTFAVCIVGSVFAIVIVKMLFGGIGKNFANPAMTARIFLVLTFAVLTKPAVNLLMGDAATGATWLTEIHKTTDAVANPNLLDLFLGVKNSAAVGEVSVLALLIGGAYLCIRKVVDPRLPLMIIGSVAVFSFLLSCINFDKAAEGWTYTGFDYKVILPSIMSGGLFLGAIFMATDYSSSPNTKWGNMLYGFAMGLLITLFRKFSEFPEGVSFAIVIMNILTPLIDKYIVPIPFGKKGQKKPKLKRPKAERYGGKDEKNNPEAEKGAA